MNDKHNPDCHAMEDIANDDVKLQEWFDFMILTSSTACYVRDYCTSKGITEVATLKLIAVELFRRHNTKETIVREKQSNA